MKIITISGRAQNGKDTVAGFLSDQLTELGKRVLIAHYADLVKYVCRTFFGWDGRKDECGRTLLQYVGTDIVRKNNPDYWVCFLLDMLDFFGDNWDFVIIPDTRFPNEIEMLRRDGYEVDHLRIIRSGFNSSLTEEQKHHASETALDDVTPDHVIYNNGTLDYLSDCVAEYIKETVYGE